MKHLLLCLCIGFSFFWMSEASTDSCPHSTYSDLANKFGEMAVFKINKAVVKDYQAGAINNSIGCARIYVRMNKASASSYKGSLTIAYKDERVVKYQTYESGSTTEENKYNRWSGWSWRPHRRTGIIEKEFQAVLEDQDAALIFKIARVEAREKELYANGEIYYKMFRHSDTAGREDVCWTSGDYMRDYRATPPRRKKCWLLTTGPWSCRPKGVLEPREPFKNINLTGALPCYKRLGLFRNLYIKGAFNVNNVSKL